MEEKGQPQGLEDPRGSQAEEEPQEGKARHEARPQQGGAGACQPQVGGEKEEGEEVAPPPQGKKG